jgi:sodium transport system permease protein
MIVGGKWLAATISSMTGVILTTALCLTMLNFIPLQDLGIRFRLGGPEVTGILAAVLPMCMLATGIQTYLSTFARSFKEAQSYMGFLMMVPMLPGMMATLYPLTNKPWMYPIPILGQHVLLADVIGGRSPKMLWFIVAGGAALAVAAVLVWLTRLLFERERIIFSR